MLMYSSILDALPAYIHDPDTTEQQQACRMSFAHWLCAVPHWCTNGSYMSAHVNVTSATFQAASAWHDRST
jgi:hypothetical protein